MKQGLVGLIFVILIIIIIFLIFQVHENSLKCKAARVKQQDQVQLAAKSAVQSATQTHPLFAYDHAVEAKNKIDEVVNTYGGTVAAERALKLPKGKLDKLRKDIYDQYQGWQNHIMEYILKSEPSLNFELNEDAGFTQNNKTSTFVKGGKEVKSKKSHKKSSHKSKKKKKKKKDKYFDD